jgi:hypothetical protein
MCAVPEAGWQDLFAKRVAAVPVFRQSSTVCWLLVFVDSALYCIRKLSSGSVYRVLSGQHQSTLLVEF